MFACRSILYCLHVLVAFDRDPMLCVQSATVTSLLLCTRAGVVSMYRERFDGLV